MINFPSPIPIASYSHFGCTWGLRAAVTAVEARLRARVYACLILFKCVCVGVGAHRAFPPKASEAHRSRSHGWTMGWSLSFQAWQSKNKAMRD